jgi:hypothetical protein
MLGPQDATDALRGSIANLAAAISADVALKPIRTRFKQQLAAIEKILQQGVTGRALAQQLAEAGVTQRDGKPLTEGHFRQALRHARRSVSHKDAQHSEASMPNQAKRPESSASSPLTRPGSDATALAAAENLARLKERAASRSARTLADKEATKKLNLRVDEMFGRKTKGS